MRNDSPKCKYSRQESPRKSRFQRTSNSPRQIQTQHYEDWQFSRQNDSPKHIQSQQIFPHRSRSSILTFPKREQFLKIF